MREHIWVFTVLLIIDLFLLYQVNSNSKKYKQPFKVKDNHYTHLVRYKVWFLVWFVILIIMIIVTSSLTLNILIENFVLK